MLVVAAQKTVDGKLAFGLQGEEVGIDQLNNVESCQARQCAEQLHDVACGCQPPRTPPVEGDVAGIVVDVGAVGDDKNLVAQLAQALSQRRVQIAVFS